VRTRWEVRRSARADVSAQENDHAARLIQT
jgi:hypothetical protein